MELRVRVNSDTGVLHQYLNLMLFSVSAFTKCTMDKFPQEMNS